MKLSLKSLRIAGFFLSQLTFNLPQIQQALIIAQAEGTPSHILPSKKKQAVIYCIKSNNND